MRILRVISSLNPASGGPGEGLRQMIAAMRSEHVNEVVTLDHPQSPWLSDVFFQVYALGPTHLGSYRYTGRLIPWILEHGNEFDLVIIHGIWQYHSYALWKALKKSGVPYLIYLHGMLDPWFKKTYPLKHLKKWLYWPWAEYRVLRDAKAVLFTCEEERLLARRSFWLYKCNETVVGYGTSQPKGDAIQQRTLFLSKFPELNGKRLFLFLSRIHEKKGCDLLIEAFAKVAENDPSLHLVMAGPDQTGWRLDLVELSIRLGLESRITWTGMILGDLKWGACHASEVLVLPSHQENFGVIVAEALACGLPVLISNKVNIWREIDEAEAGLVAEDNLEGTTELLRKWLSMESAQRDSMRKNAVACFMSRFDIDKAAKNLLKIIEDEAKKI